MAKKKAEAIKEFHFEHDCANSGRLMYRCMELSIVGEGDEFTASELELIDDIVELLNRDFPHIK